MGRGRKKETYSQKVVGLATMGMPAPVQTVAKSRWVSRLLILVVPILIAMGVITVSFNGGLPSITVNQQRANDVGRQIEQEAIRAAERVRQYGDSGYR